MFPQGHPIFTFRQCIQQDMLDEHRGDTGKLWSPAIGTEVAGRRTVEANWVRPAVREMLL
jgi:hypothetical protein